MAKKVLILTGSPRRGGNSDSMAAAFKLGAEKAGAEVQQVDMAELNVKGCNVCDKCWTDDMVCVFQDDMQKVYPLLEWADMLVFAFPIYYFTYPAQIKVFFDRLYPYAFQNQEKAENKEAVLLVCGEIDDPSVFDGVISTYRITCSYMKWNDSGVVCATGVNHIGDIQGTQWLEKAQDLGEAVG